MENGFMVDGVVVDYRYASVKFSNLQGGDLCTIGIPRWQQSSLRILPLYTAAYLDDQRVYYRRGLPGGLPWIHPVSKTAAFAN